MLNRFFKRVSLVLLFTAGSYNAYGFEIGVNAHFGNYKEDAEYYLSLIKNYGFTSVRDDFAWQSNELSKGVYKVAPEQSKNDYAFTNSLAKHNISSLLILDYGNKLYGAYRDYPRTPEAIQAFANYSYWVASRYKGKVKYYEIWNEWFNGTGVTAKPRILPPPGIYFELVKATYLAVKKADPNAIVMTGSFNPVYDKSRGWFDEQIKLGILNYIDGISIHPYNYLLKKESDRSAEDNIKAIISYHDQIVKSQGKDVPIYITEMGIPNYQGKGGLTRADSSKFIAKYTLLARSTSFIKGIWWYDLKDDGVNPSYNEDNFGLLDYNGKPKSAALDLLKISNVIKKYQVGDTIYGKDGKVSVILGEANKESYVYWYQNKAEDGVSLRNIFPSAPKLETYVGITEKNTEDNNDYSDIPKIIIP